MPVSSSWFGREGGIGPWMPSEGSWSGLGGEEGSSGGIRLPLGIGCGWVWEGAKGLAVVVVWVVEVGGGLPPNSLRFTICCISAKVPPESTWTMTHMVSGDRNHTMLKISKNMTYPIQWGCQEQWSWGNSFVMTDLTCSNTLPLAWVMKQALDLPLLTWKKLMKYYFFSMLIIDT